MTRSSNIREFLSTILQYAEDTGSIACTIHADSWSSCMYWLDEAKKQLRNRIGDQSSHIVVISQHQPDVVRAVHEDEFQEQRDNWVRSICSELQEARSSDESRTHGWAIIAPKFFTPHFDQVPIVYWAKLWDRFYGHLQRKLQNGRGGIYDHAVVGDPFFIESTLHREDLWCGDALRGYIYSYSPEACFRRNQIMKSVAISGLAQRLHDHQQGYGMEKEIANARALLVKRFLGGLVLDGSARIGDLDVGKRGDMILLQIQEGESPFSYYWCKFGSPKKLFKEYANTQKLRRRVRSLRNFLYITQYGDCLPADYIGLLVSEHEDNQDGMPKTRTLERFYEQLVGQNQFDRLPSVFSELGLFLDALHWPGKWENVSTFMSNKKGTKYDFLLTSARCSQKSSGNPLVQGKGDYEIDLIVPRDNRRSELDSDREYVIIHLKPRNEVLANPRAFERLLLGWTAPNWRWQLWLEGFKEGSFVDIKSSIRNTLEGSLTVPGDRISGHLKNFRDSYERGTNQDYFQSKYRTLIENLQRFLQVEISEQGSGSNYTITLQNNCKVKIPSESSPLLEYDIYPNSLHGDFHLRNVLVLGTEASIKLKIIDLAYAIVDRDADSYVAPIAYDFATLEVDAKAKMLFNVQFSDRTQTPHPNDDLKLLNQLDQKERQVWDGCQGQLPTCFQSTWNNYQDDAQSPSQPNVEELGMGFYFVAAWRDFCLRRLWQMTELTDQNVISFPDSNAQNQLQKSNWTPARSYAQALFLASISYLKLLDPDEDKKQGLACIVSAIHALEVLTAGESS